MSTQSFKTLLYVMTGDTSDVDGYAIAFKLPNLRKWMLARGVRLRVAIVVPQRIACKSMESKDVMEHDEEYAKDIARQCGRIFAFLAGVVDEDDEVSEVNEIDEDVFIVDGGKNDKNIFPAAKQFNELAHFVGPVKTLLSEATARTSRSYLTEREPRPLSYLAKQIRSPDTHMVMLDGNGSLGFMTRLQGELEQQGTSMREMGDKMKASGLAMPVMAGVLAEVTPTTLPVPDRDPRATMNAIYSPQGFRSSVELARDHDVPLLFVTNNACVNTLKFGIWKDILEYMGIDVETRSIDSDDDDDLRKRVLAVLAEAWYGQAFLSGHYVLYDVLCFCAMVRSIDDRFPLSGSKNTEEPNTDFSTQVRTLFMGSPSAGTPSDVLVLLLEKEGTSRTEAEVKNLIGTERMLDVKCLDPMDREVVKRVWTGL
jgi:hypothetical protein